MPEISKADGQVQRALNHFSVIYAAGALASEFSILPFPATCIQGAVEAAFRTWIDVRGAYGSFEEEQAISAIREVIESHQSQFQTETSSFAPRECVGIQFSKDGQSYFGIFTGAWRNEICRDLDPRAVAKIALKHGFLEPERDARGAVSNLQRKVTFDGCRRRVYWISATILGEKADEQAADEGDQEMSEILDFLEAKRTRKRRAIKTDALTT
jgi:hypothetical protein